MCANDDDDGLASASRIQPEIEFLSRTNEDDDTYMKKNAIHTCLLWVGTSTPGTRIIPSSATTLQSLVESDWKRMRKFTSTHAYVLPFSVFAATYLCCIPRYVHREESGLSLGLVKIFIKKLYFFSIQNAKGNTVSFACKIITISVAL